MFIVESYALAVIMCVVTMLCWGSWANTQKLASREWPFQLFYWDYAAGVVILSLIGALTLGSTGTVGRSFAADLAQANGSSFFSAFTGGVVFNLANILLVAAIDIAGMSVAFPVAIGLALVIGVVTNYIATPLGNPVMLFAGVGFVTIAILLSATAYGKLSTTTARTPVLGIVISIIGGILMGFFYRFVAASMSPDFAKPVHGMLSPYTAVVLFSIGLFCSNFVFNSIMMIRPLSGRPVKFGDYFSMGNTRLHLIGILGGIIWCIGMLFSIIASGQAGFAISYGLGQGATMVAAFWGVFIWKEFHNAPAGTNRILNSMFAAFIIGLALIIAARVM